MLPSSLEINSHSPQIPKTPGGPNDATLYSESHKRSKMIETHLYRLYSKMTVSKIIAGSPLKV